MDENLEIMLLEKILVDVPAKVMDSAVQVESGEVVAAALRTVTVVAVLP